MNADPAAARKKLVLIIVLVVVGVVVLVVGVLLVATGLGVATVGRLRHAQADQAATDAAAIRDAATLYVVQHPGGHCPTVADLVGEQLIRSSAPAMDPWGNPFMVSCDGPDLGVASAGPDGTMGTPDDIVVH